jgi:hypothetical protein
MRSLQLHGGAKKQWRLHYNRLTISESLMQKIVRKLFAINDERLIHAQPISQCFIYRGQMIAVQWQRNGSFNNGKA